jgi:hypothetical protein
LVVVGVELMALFVLSKQDILPLALPILLIRALRFSQGTLLKVTQLCKEARSVFKLWLI